MAESGTEYSDAVGEIIRGWAQTRPELDVSALEIFGRLHRSYLLYRSSINANFERFGTNEAGFDVLASLRRAEPDHRRTAGELAKQTLVTTGGLTLRVNRLEDAGLVTRERDETDARVVYVTLTDAGHELIDSVADAHFAELDRMLAGVGVRDRATLARLLSALEGSLHAATDEETLPGAESA
ncbi:MarR family transcriptional regulator [Rhodococcus rhodnii]|uniref:MarR family transcriptional regulator n=2 Tax=Rhodococcus rhodnii TaxID=38312 RepID=R7WHB1_9NOCA|nr:MarR family transcriptional regulator [Rhodococcus rhodnii]EOM74498.1 MarR family transcriptional regulator [Rhodococcus rhodnii LMG 5362]TXG89186.1 MarR family transcriptional regulator [Rhodococcus rhodnii]